MAPGIIPHSYMSSFAAAAAMSAAINAAAAHRHMPQTMCVLLRRTEKIFFFLVPLKFNDNNLKRTVNLFKTTLSFQVI